MAEILVTWRGDTERLDAPALLQRCTLEAASARMLVLYADEVGDELLAGALVEMGAALGAGVPVALVVGPHHGQLDKRCGFASHPLVTRFASVEDAILAAGYPLGVMPQGISG